MGFVMQVSPTMRPTHCPHLGLQLADCARQLHVLARQRLAARPQLRRLVRLGRQLTLVVGQRRLHAGGQLRGVGTAHKAGECLDVAGGSRSRIPTGELVSPFPVRTQ